MFRDACFNPQPSPWARKELSDECEDIRGITSRIDRKERDVPVTRMGRRRDADDHDPRDLIAAEADQIQRRAREWRVANDDHVGAAETFEKLENPARILAVGRTELGDEEPIAIAQGVSQRNPEWRVFIRPQQQHWLTCATSSIPCDPIVRAELSPRFLWPAGARMR